MPLDPEQQKHGLAAGRYLVYSAVALLRSLQLPGADKPEMSGWLPSAIQWGQQVTRWREQVLIHVEDPDDEGSEFIEINEALIYLADMIEQVL